MKSIYWGIALVTLAAPRPVSGQPRPERLHPPHETAPQGGVVQPILWQQSAPSPVEAATSPTEDLADMLADMAKRIEELEAKEKARDQNSQETQSDAKEPGGTKNEGAKEDKKESKKDGEKKDGDKKDKDAAPKEGWVDVSSEKWTVKLGGHIQGDYVNWANASPSIPRPLDYFEFRRLRLVADGTGYGVFDFRLQMTLEPEATTDAGTDFQPAVKDAYVSMNEIPFFNRVRIGNFFVPFGLEQVTNDTNNIFMERSIPTQGIFTADREVGIASYMVSPDQNATFTYGAFFDSISEAAKLRIDSNQGYRLSARATWLPFYDEPSNGRYLIHTGCGILFTDDQDDRVRFRARPQIHAGPRIIDSGNLIAPTYTTANIEGAVVWGRVTVQSEAYLSNVNLRTGPNENAYGAYAHLSYFLTGENRIFERFGQHGAQFGRNVPISNFFLTSGGRSWGAWEAKARWSYLDLTSFTRGQYNDFTLGMNWYWTDRMRVMFDWIHPLTSSNAIFGETESDILAMRFDVNW